MSETAPAETPPRRQRWLRGLWRGLAVGATLLALVMATALVLVHHLDSPWVKRRIEREVEHASGFRVDWRTLDVALFHGLRLEGLTVDSPEAFKAVAPHLLEIDSVAVDASVASGLHAVVVKGIRLALVQGPNRASWEPETPGAPAPPPSKPGPGLSRVLNDLFAKPPPVPKVSVEDISATFTQLDGAGRVEQKVSLKGVALSTHHWDVALGSAASPLRLELAIEDRKGSHAATVNLFLGAHAAAREAKVEAHLQVERQDWSPKLELKGVLDLEANARFLPEQRRIEVSARRIALLDGAGELHAEAWLLDAPGSLPELHGADGEVDLGRVVRTLAPLGLPATLDQGHLQLKTKTGESVELTARLGTAGFSQEGLRAEARNVDLAATARLLAPYHARLSLSGHWAVGPPRGSAWFDDAAHATVEADVADLSLSHGRAAVEVSGPWGEVKAEDDHSAKGDDTRVSFSVPSLRVAAPFLPVLPWRADWGDASVKGHLQARANVKDKPFSLEDAGEVELTGLTLHPPGGPVTVRSLSVQLASHGSARVHHAETHLKAAVSGLASKADGEQTLDAVVDVDAREPKVHATVKSDGTLAPSIAADLKGQVERASNELRVDASGHVGALSRVATALKHVPAVAGVDVSKMDADLTLSARLRGLVSGISDEGVPRFVKDPLARIRGQAQAKGELHRVRWFHEDQSADVAAVTFDASAQGDPKLSAVTANVRVEGARFARDEDTFTLGPTSLRLSGTMKPQTGEARAEANLQVGAVGLSQPLGYPMDGLTVSLSAERQPDGILHAPRMHLENPSAGTILDAHGGFAPEETKLFLQGDLQQDVSKAWRDPQVFTGKGQLRVGFKVESNDLRVFHASAQVALDHVSLSLPQQRATVEDINGEVPLVSAFEKTARGVAIVRGHAANAYASARFADQHPLFRQRSYVSIQRVTSPQLTVESIAGNMKVDHNLIALEQLEMSVRGGHLAGQCLFDMDEKNIRAKAELRATGILSSHGEPFDGNAALVVSLTDRSIDGRAQITRIGRRHLLDLLDIQDPQHAVPAMNRVRQALALGYPDEVNVTFARGFANVHIAFGGIARLVKVDDIKGVPMEPLIDRYVREQP